MFMDSADTILSMKRPEALFPNSVIDAKRIHRELGKRWHPDVCKDSQAGIVFDHVTKLYEQAMEKILGGYWGFAGVETFSGRGKSFTVKYWRERRFELGRCLIASDEVVYVLDAVHVAFSKALSRSMAAFKYGTPEMKTEVLRYLPTEVTFAGQVVRIRKQPELLSLRDVLDHYGASLPPKAAAWVISSLCSLCCFLEYAGLVHGDISPDTYFIDPTGHYGALLGGWWYSAPRGATLRHLPARTFRFLPWKVRTEKRASRLIDAELLLATGREILGDIDGKHLDRTIPVPMLAWLTTVATAGAVENYRSWGVAREKSFGPRQFTEMQLTEKMLYQQ
jgi:hypothetical protein